MGTKTRSPWAWIPTLYFAEGIPYVVVMTVSVIMYKRMGISNTDIALYTSWLYLPWVIKPFWSPIVDLLKTKRWWIVIMQLLIGARLAGIAFTIPMPSFFQYTLAFFWLMAFSSATHDIAADGFYMLGLKEHEQAFFVGIRSTFYRLAMITGQGLLIILAGALESRTGLEPVRFEISSEPNRKTESEGLNENLTFAEEAGDLRFILSNESLVIPIESISNEEAHEISTWAKSNNQANGFIEEEKVLEEKSPSWWSTSISGPLKSKLKASWGKTENVGKSASPKQGNIGAMGIHLSSSPNPGEEVVLILGRKSGDKNFNLIHGERLVFTENNWNKNAWVLVQIDPKLEKPARQVLRDYPGIFLLRGRLRFMYSPACLSCFLCITALFFHIRIQMLRLRKARAC
jgi:PAT family beta-lactamase induction signal transducer AmpG